MHLRWILLEISQKQAEAMTAEQILDLVAHHLCTRFEVPREKIKPQANLFKELGLDSIDALDMLGLLEAELKIEMKEDELRKLRTVQDVVDYILRHPPALAGA